MDKSKTTQAIDNVKQKMPFFASVIMPFLSAICFYIILCSGMAGESSIYTLVVSMIFPAAYCCTLITSKTNFSRALPLIASVLAFAVSVATNFVTFSDFAFVSQTIIYAAGCIAISAIMFYFCIKKYTKTAMLVAISVVLCLMVLLSLCADVLSQNGFLSTNSVIEEINSLFKTLKEGVMSVYTNILDNEDLFNSFKSTLSGILSQEELTKENLLSILSTGVDAILSIVRSCLPAIVALSSMAKAFVIIAFFSVFIKAAGLMVCDYEGKWEYSVSGITARVFNAMLFIAVLGSIIGLPSIIIVASVNLVVILTPLLNIVAIKNIFNFMKSRNIHPVACVLLICVAFLISTTIFQLYSFVILDFIGVYITTLKERIKIFENKNK